MNLEDFLLLICFMVPFGILMWVGVTVLLVGIINHVFDVDVVEKLKNWRKPNG